ncbi:unnamed protein product [Mytilus coruscus]|uniref:DDE Tnp4 domain-containing protein n=1 Tax=Mytilus coruscus TaxID=42192 RepID=A0A6J8AJ67_MYTCO|nr:unnamed protein product [Mytilus coruscus]
MDNPVLLTVLCETFLNENDHCTLPIQVLSYNNVIGALFHLLHGKRWDVPRTEGYSERVIPRFISEDYRVHFRISKDMFDTIHEEIEPKLIFEHRGGNEQITPRKQLLLFLCYMANNETFRELGQYFGVGKSTAHVYNTVTIILPSLQRQDELSREIQLLHMLPNIIGAIDGTHIRLSSCPSNDNDYYNRKGFPSMQLQLVVDNTLKILDVYSGWPGCTHDARVLRNSSLCRRAEGGELFGPHKVIVGDSAYPVKNWLITPFKDNGYLSARQKRFNKALSSFRQAVERTIGHVKGRFRRLRELTIHEPKQIVLTILAGCILHNLCIIAHEDIDLYIDRDNDNHTNNYVNIFQNDVGGVEIRQQMMENLP